MTIKKIRKFSEGPKESGCRNKKMCDAICRIDEDFIYHIDRDILNHTPEQSAPENIDDILNDKTLRSEINKKMMETEWYNSYPFGTETVKVYSRFLGICRGDTRLDAVLKAAVRHSEAVVKFCPKQTCRTIVILTDKWYAKTFAKYEKDFIQYAFKHDIFPVFLLVTDYGYTQIPFLPNDREKVGELVLDEYIDKEE